MIGFHSGVVVNARGQYPKCAGGSTLRATGSNSITSRAWSALVISPPPAAPSSSNENPRSWLVAAELFPPKLPITAGVASNGLAARYCRNLLRLSDIDLEARMRLLQFGFERYVRETGILL
jgi:hypothetical protein